MKSRKFTDEQVINAVKNQQNITQRELAKVLDCSVSSISNNIRNIVKDGRLIQTADNDGVYHYDVPERKLPVTVHSVPKVVTIVSEVPIDLTKSWIKEIKAELKLDIDGKVREYLNKQYLRIMEELNAEFGIN